MWQDSFQKTCEEVHFQQNQCCSFVNLLKLSSPACMFLYIFTTGGEEIVISQNSLLLIIYIKAIEFTSAEKKTVKNTVFKATIFCFVILIMFLFCYKDTNLKLLFSNDTNLKIFCSCWQDYSLIILMLSKQ